MMNVHALAYQEIFQEMTLNAKHSSIFPLVNILLNCFSCFK